MGAHLPPPEMMSLPAGCPYVVVAGHLPRHEFLFTHRLQRSRQECAAGPEVDVDREPLLSRTRWIEATAGKCPT
jgi:hypothetical protein